MEILNTYTFNDTGWAAFAFVLLVASVVFLGLGISEMCHKRIKNGILYGVGVVICVGLCYGCGIVYDHYNRVRYDVVITEMSKFDYQKYTIVGQKGKVITIEEIKK